MPIKNLARKSWKLYEQKETRKIKRHHLNRMNLFAPKPSPTEPLFNMLTGGQPPDFDLMDERDFLRLFQRAISAVVFGMGNSEVLPSVFFKPWIKTVGKMDHVFDFEINPATKKLGWEAQAEGRKARREYEEKIQEITQKGLGEENVRKSIHNFETKGKRVLEAIVDWFESANEVNALSGQPVVPKDKMRQMRDLFSKNPGKMFEKIFLKLCWPDLSKQEEESSKNWRIGAGYAGVNSGVKKVFADYKRPGARALRLKEIFGKGRLSHKTSDYWEHIGGMEGVRAARVVTADILGMGVESLRKRLGEHRSSKRLKELGEIVYPMK